MSQENVDVVRTVLEAQRRRDWGAFRRLYDAEIEWEDASGLWGDWGTRRGFEDVRDAWVTWFEAFEQVDFDLGDLLDAGGDEVVAFIRISARGRESGLVWTSGSRACGRCRAARSCG
jgi:ketosteroid isomerase-like protein